MPVGAVNVRLLCCYYCRWSRLRISDAAKLERSKLTDDGKLFLYTQKTGQPVYVPLPPSVAKSLRELPNLENSRISSGTVSAPPRVQAKNGGGS